jgi:flagellar biosynthesis/type III secretory pathway protein FliH
MIFGEYDREMDIAVNRREAREEGRSQGREEGIGVGLAQGREEGRKEIFSLFEQGLSVDEIKERLQ